jgi:valyl-tRNA synthetase
MSKSKGNVVDPIETIDEFGTDALRFTLLVGSTPGNDMNLSLSKVEGNRNFANKIWNMARFILGSLEKAPAAAEKAPQYTLADSWIWARMNELIRSVERLFDAYLFGEAGRQIYEFLWNEFADWYLEIAKLQLQEGGDRAFYTAYTLTRVFDTCLRLLHPYIPYVTEELWQYLKQTAQEHSPALAPNHGEWEEALIIARWPEAQPLEGWEEQKVAEFGIVQEVVRAIRNLRAEKKLNPGKLVPAIIAAGDMLPILSGMKESLVSLAKVDPEHCQLVEAITEPPQDAISAVTAGISIFLPMAGMVDTDAEKERIEHELAEVTAQIKRLETLLASPFAQKAPANVVEKEREKLAVYQETAEKLNEQMANLG